jgi:C1A family cysteine protease
MSTVLPKRTVQWYGWKRDLPDFRDHKFKSPRRGPLPSKVDLTTLMPNVYDQLDIGSCTANSLAGLCQFLMLKQGIASYVPSRLFIYWNERDIEGDVANDSGASLRDGMTVLSKLGVPHEYLWWYNTKKYAVKPNKAVYTDAKQHLITEYLSIDNTKITDIKTCLAQGYPISFGFTAYESLESDVVAQTGVLPMPSKTEQIIGGHAVVLCGFSDKERVVIVRNSWGTDWGKKGYFTMPYDYITNTDLADDFWTAHHIS